MDDLKRTLKDRVRATVERGRNIREEIHHLATEASQTFHEEAENLSGLVDAVLQGAVEGVRSSPAGQADSALRQVIDGLGDAFITSAQAVKLTLEEARGTGAQFAQEDLERIAREFRSLGELFVEAVGRALQALGAQASAQSDALREHSKHTFSQMRSHLQEAAQAASENLRSLPGEALQAGTAAVRQAAGVFFNIVGDRLKATGERLRPKDSEADSRS